jgi:hypothetical protein
MGDVVGVYLVVLLHGMGDDGHHNTDVRTVMERGSLT